jgi:hypothetical protein
MRVNSEKRLTFAFYSLNMTGMSSMSLALGRPVSPWLEMGAYEALWTDFGTWFKSLAEKFREHPGSLPSDFVADRSQAYAFSERTLKLLEKGGVTRFGVRVHGTGDYPARLRDAEYPLEVLYYQGWWDLIATRGVAIAFGRRNKTRQKTGQVLSKRPIYCYLRSR